MRGDLLSGGAPKRLTQEDGKWTLEVIRQVAVDKSVYRPHTQLLDGPELIMRYLKRNPTHRPLASAALTLLQSPSNEPARSFDAVNGEWLPSQIAPGHLEQLKRTQREAASRSQYVQLLELRTEHVRLLQAHRALVQRVDELFNRVVATEAELEVVKNQRPVMLEAPRAEEPAIATATASVEAESETIEDVDPARPKLELPHAKDFVVCLEQLIGGDTAAEQLDEPLLVKKETRNLYSAQLVGDNDMLLGAVVMDLAATVYLGGTLLMVPDAELTSQVNRKSPSEDSLAASAEVCNALSGSINNVPGNAHIRCQYLEQLDFDAMPWLSKPRLHVTLKDNYGGTTMVAAR